MLKNCARNWKRSSCNSIWMALKICGSWSQAAVREAVESKCTRPMRGLWTASQIWRAIPVSGSFKSVLRIRSLSKEGSLTSVNGCWWPIGIRSPFGATMNATFAFACRSTIRRESRGRTIWQTTRSRRSLPNSMIMILKAICGVVRSLPIILMMNLVRELMRIRYGPRSKNTWKLP